MCPLGIPAEVCGVWSPGCSVLQLLQSLRSPQPMRRAEGHHAEAMGSSCSVWRMRVLSFFCLKRADKKIHPVGPHSNVLTEAASELPLQCSVFTSSGLSACRHHDRVPKYPFFLPPLSSFLDSVVLILLWRKKARVFSNSILSLPT